MHKKSNLSLKKLKLSLSGWLQPEWDFLALWNRFVTHFLRLCVCHHIIFEVSDFRLQTLNPIIIQWLRINRMLVFGDFSNELTFGIEDLSDCLFHSLLGFFSYLGAKFLHSLLFKLIQDVQFGESRLGLARLIRLLLFWWGTGLGGADFVLRG